MDLKTLWDRLSDAIDTVIRRDDSTESESRDLLQPCIEGTLDLPFLFFIFPVPIMIFSLQCDNISILTFQVL